MNEVQLLLDLPFETLAVLAAGYLSYRLAYTGRDAAHATVDVVFLVMVFAVIAKAAGLALVALMPALALPVCYAVALGFAVAAAAIWRRWSHWVARVLRRLGISTSDRQGNAWGTFLAEENKSVTSLVVRKKNGETVMSESLSDFENVLCGPCVLGEDGSVALYVTDFRSAHEAEWEETDPRDSAWGPALTFIPASEIAWVRIRTLA